LKLMAGKKDKDTGGKISFSLDGPPNSKHKGDPL